MTSRKARFAEVAGGTAAECAAVCCCCPCGLINLVVLAVIRLPASLCRKSIEKQRRKKKVSILQEQPKRNEDDAYGIGLAETSPETWPDKPPSVVVSEMEETWTKVYGTGFWRSPSEMEH